MSYQIKRTEKISDVLELCDEGGNVVSRLNIAVDIDAIAAELRKRLTNVQTAEKLLKRAASEQDCAEAYGLYGQTVTDIFCVCFGQENTEKITEHFGGDYIEMSVAVVPYIYEVILPRVNEALLRRKEQLKAVYGNRKRFKLR